MIHVVDRSNRKRYSHALLEMHRQRKEIFVDSYGWKLPVRDGGEYDEFDDDEAVYFLAFDPDGTIACSTRLRPAHDASIIACHFPHLIAADERPVDDGRTWEFARAVAVGSCKGLDGARRKAELRLAMLEVALDRGADRFVGFMDVSGIPHLESTGWTHRYVGLPAAYAEGTAIAFEVEVSEAAIARKRSSWNIDYDVFHGATGHASTRPDHTGTIAA